MVQHQHASIKTHDNILYTCKEDCGILSFWLINNQFDFNTVCYQFYMIAFVAIN